MTFPSAERRVGFSLGSNVGDRLAYLEKACDALFETFGNLRVSRVYETEPVGCPPGSPLYLNACVEAYTKLPPEEILSVVQKIEAMLGRQRLSGVYGEPRTCDIDILYVGEEVVNTRELTLPHPRACSRAFVLQPLCDIDPHMKLPGEEKNVHTLLQSIDKSSIKLFPL